MRRWKVVQVLCKPLASKFFQRLRCILHFLWDPNLASLNKSLIRLDPTSIGNLVFIEDECK